MINIFRQNKKNFLLAILILAAASTGVTLTAVYASCGAGTSSTTNPFCPPYQLQDSSNGNAVRVTVDSSGNVGIGTTTPTTTLDVASSTLDVRLVADSPAANYAGVQFQSAGASKGGIFYRANDGDRQQFWVGGGERMSILGSGNVGIGTTSPSTILHVFSSTSDVRLALDSPAANYAGVQFQSAGTSKGGIYYSANAGDRQQFWVGGGERMSILGSGNVGIGTTTPAQKLDVSGNIRLSGNIVSSNIGAMSVTAPNGLCLGNC